MKYLTQKLAQNLDVELMNASTFGFTLEQLMEAAGLSVACAICKQRPPTEQRQKTLICAGPGNNGGDGLVVARHLKLFGYESYVYYPKLGKNPFFKNLVTQCKTMDIPFLDDLPTVEMMEKNFDIVVDGIFGFSFNSQRGIQPPFDTIISNLQRLQTPMLVSIDIPSGWDVETGNSNGMGLNPDMLVSLTAPKLCAQTFDKIHYLGGRFVPERLAKKYDLQLPVYPGCDQCVKL